MEASTVKSVSFQTDKETTRQRLVSIAQQKAIDDGVIDPYALRNYWRLIGGETEIVDKPWGDTNTLVQQLKSYNQTDEVVSGDNSIETVVAVATKSRRHVQTIINKIEAEYGSNVPVKFQGDLLLVHERWIWAHNVSLQELRAATDL